MLIRAEYMMGHKGPVALDQNYKTDTLEMAAVYVKVAPNLIIDHVESLKNSAKRISANIQESESEKDATMVHLVRKASGLEKQQGRGVPAMLEMIKRTKGTTGADSADTNALAGFLEQIDAAHRANVREMDEKSKGEMDEPKKNHSRDDQAPGKSRGRSAAPVPG